MRLRWVGHIVRKGRWEIRAQFLLVSLKGSDCSEEIGVGGRIVLKSIREIVLDGMDWTCLAYIRDPAV